MSTITVKSHLPISLTVHLDRLVETDHGAREARRIGSEVVLKPGLNPGIDAAFWSAWTEAHRGEPLADHFTVIAEEEPGDPLPPHESPPLSDAWTS